MITRRASALALLGLAACNHYDPRPVYVPAASVHGESPSGRVTATYVKTVAEGRAPLVELSIEPDWTRDGVTWTGIRGITVLGAGWSDIHLTSYDKKDHEEREPRTVRFEVPTDDPGPLFHVLVDRDGAPQQQLQLRLALTEVRMAVAPIEEERSRDTWLAVTYPIWGLPRDLLDAPLTAFNRFGLGKIYGGETFEDPKPPVVGLYAVSAVTGFIWGSVWGFHQAGHHYLQSYFYAFGGSIGGGLAGGAAALALDAVWGAVVNPVQVALLRTGIDDEYVKTTSPRIEIAGAWTEDDLRQYDTLVRGHAYFPNWQYVVHERTLSLPSAEAGVEVWTVSEIELLEP